MQNISKDAVELAVKTIANTAIANEKYFSELDSAAGDADFGVSLASGFKAILKQWDSIDHSSISAFLMKVGVIITSNVGGCSGPIWGTGFMRAGSASKGKESLIVADLVAMFRAAIDGIMARGGAKLGDKTLLDAVAPATDILEKWSRETPQDVLGALQAAADGASDAIESTKGWEAKQGRQSFTGERSKGTVDPGIVAVATMMQAVTKALREVYG